MLKVWTILLLCSLQPFQQAVAQEEEPETKEFHFKNLLRLVAQAIKRNNLEDLRGGTLDNQGGPVERKRRDLLGGDMGGKKGLPGNALGDKKRLPKSVLNQLKWKIVNADVSVPRLEPLPGGMLQMTRPFKMELLGNSPGAALRKARPSGAPTDFLRIRLEIDIIVIVWMAQDEFGAPKLVVENSMANVTRSELSPGSLKL